MVDDEREPFAGAQTEKLRCSVQPMLVRLRRDPMEGLQRVREGKHLSNYPFDQPRPEGRSTRCDVAAGKRACGRPLSQSPRLLSYQAEWSPARGHRPQGPARRRGHALDRGVWRANYGGYQARVKLLLPLIVVVALLCVLSSARGSYRPLVPGVGKPSQGVGSGRPSARVTSPVVVWATCQGRLSA